MKQVNIYAFAASASNPFSTPFGAANITGLDLIGA